jgi:hypothetical protein
MKPIVTKSDLKQAVKVKRRQEGSSLVFSGGIVFSASVRVDRNYSTPEMIKEAEAAIVDQIWWSLYGGRLDRYHATVDKLMKCDPYDPVRWSEIVRELHALAPMERENSPANV